MRTKHFSGRILTLSAIQSAALLLFLVACTGGVFATAIEPIPEKDGFSGFFNIGGSWMQMKSNTIVGTRFGDLSKDRIDSLDDTPDSESLAMPMINGELRYTFADTGTQLFAGNALDDWIRLDLSSAAGVRQRWDDKGIFEGAFLFTAVPTEVWEDPYVVGQKREEADRTSAGGRLGWSRVFNSNVHLSYSYRDIELDDENSGILLGLSPAERDLLSREGDHHKAELLYVHQLRENQWLTPTFYYNRFDLDGEAMSHDLYSVMLTHTYAAQKFRLITNLVYGFAGYDERNPIYHKTRDADRYGISVTTLYPNLFNVPKLTGVLGVAYWLEDSNIDFYDSEIVAITASTLYRF
ncbi:MAG: DUF2860 family protein [Planctomycetota bacterium]